MSHDDEVVAIGGCHDWIMPADIMPVDDDEVLVQVSLE